MSLDTIRRSLLKTLSEPKNWERFQEMRSQHQTLSAFEGPQKVVEFLHHRSDEESYRSKVTAALIEIAQQDGGDLAVSMLTLAFLPGLMSICHVIALHSGLSDEEIHSLLFESFLQRIQQFNLDALGRRAVVNLIFGTRKMAQNLAKQEADRRLKEVAHAQTDFVDGPAFSPENWAIYKDLFEHEGSVYDRLERLISDESEESQMILWETYGRGQPLIEWVRQHYPDLDHSSFQAKYSKLRRFRTRVVNRLKRRAKVSDFKRKLSKQPKYKAENYGYRTTNAVSFLRAGDGSAQSF